MVALPKEHDSHQCDMLGTPNKMQLLHVYKGDPSPTDYK
jgi:hypothetical protein